ncbi:SGNH/GDSL hydrolase family protein [Aeromicrobium sp.]|uniref:SGNH/GDSL hydrolase family protein n=1 Tax=Aeromicrobium sp. TaxID=1871063 RepID=UPI0028AF939C|nr:SGNH/GDSL hydrolase family protein [Aeromicrobium sp.]
MRPILSRSLASLAGVALTAGLVSATSATGAAAAPTPGGEHYVALGDSFVSGPGIPVQRPEDPTCARSTRNFVSVVAETIDAASFTDASCSAATTADWWASQSPGVEPQLDALKPDTTLVTLGTMGGNDVGLVGLATTCLMQGCSTLPPEPFHEKIDALVPIYRKVIEDVRERSPHAKIVAVGYGTYVPLETCPALVNAKDADLVYLQGMIDRLSDTIKGVAADEDVAFVEMRDIAGWRDHTACADPADQWVRGLNGYGDGITLHPSTAGMAQMAIQSLKTIEPLIAEPEPAPTPAPTPKPTSKQRVDAAAKTLNVRAVCSGPRARQRVTLRTTGGSGLVKAVSFRVGRKWLVVDRKAPFKVTRSAKSLRTAKARGPVSAKVGLRHGKVVRAVTVRTKRPACLR